MSLQNEFSNNNVDLQSILDTVNSLPVQENLDSELATQDDLISQITAALEFKTVPKSKIYKPMAIYMSDYSSIKACLYEEGMTWAEWCDSDYNTVEFYITEGNNVYTLSGFPVKTSANNYLNGADIIIDEKYMIKIPSGL